MNKNAKLISLIAFTIIMAVSPAFLDAYWVDVLNNIGLYAILVLSLNLILGYAGLFHMGHAAFYAVGATSPFTPSPPMPLSAKGFPRFLKAAGFSEP